MESLKRKEIKWEQEDLDTIERGAACLGLDSTALIRLSSLKAAREALEQKQRIIISDEAFNAMMEDTDDAPNENLIKLMK